MAQVVVRLERQGKLIAYGIESNTLGGRVGLLTPQMIEMLPPIVVPLVDGVLFGLRHGPLQALLRKAGMPKLEAFEQAYKDAYANVTPPVPPGTIKHAATMDALCRCIFQTLHDKSINPETGELTAVDIRANDVTSAADGLITRLPDWDGDVPPENTVESDGPRGLSEPQAEVAADTSAE